MNNNKYSSQGFVNKFFRPVDNSPLVIFRILFGFLLFYHVCSILLNGTVYRNFIQPPFTFTFIGFEFLQPLPGNGMYYYFGTMALLALLVMFGAWYRFAMTGFAFLWTVQYLMQKSGYNNHYYLVLLLCWMMAFVPANAYCSVDAFRKKTTRSNTCPQWVPWIFIAQIAILYFFAAINKLNVDWFSGKFLSIQFTRLSSHHIYGMLYGMKWFPVFIAYAGFLFDLLIIPFLLWNPTRRTAFFLACIFHLFNSFTFKIGIFPYLSIALFIFFFEPDNIRSLFFKNKASFKGSESIPLIRKPVIYLLSVYFMLQVIVPMRSWLYPGNVFWTEEGYRMSWKMMLRTKSGSIHFKVIDPVSGKTWIVDPGKIFSQYHVTWIAISPDITWQYAQKIKKEFEEKGVPNVKVYAIGLVSMNRSKPMPLVDTTVDLGSTKWNTFKHSAWITQY